MCNSCLGHKNQWVLALELSLDRFYPISPSSTVEHSSRSQAQTLSGFSNISSNNTTPHGPSTRNGSALSHGCNRSLRAPDCHVVGRTKDRAPCRGGELQANPFCSPGSVATREATLVVLQRDPPAARCGPSPLQGGRMDRRIRARVGVAPTASRASCCEFWFFFFVREGVENLGREKGVVL